MTQISQALRRICQIHDETCRKLLAIMIHRERGVKGEKVGALKSKHTLLSISYCKYGPIWSHMVPRNVENNRSCQFLCVCF